MVLYIVVPVSISPIFYTFLLIWLSGFCAFCFRVVSSSSCVQERPFSPFLHLALCRHFSDTDCGFSSIHHALLRHCKVFRLCCLARSLFVFTLRSSLFVMLRHAAMPHIVSHHTLPQRIAYHHFAFGFGFISHRILLSNIVYWPLLLLRAILLLRGAIHSTYLYILDVRK